MARLHTRMFAVPLTLAVLVVTVSASQRQSQPTVALRFITPMPGASLHGFVTITVIDAHRTNLVRSLSLEVRRARAVRDRWQLVGTAQSVVSDVMRIGLDTRQLAAGWYVFRVRPDDLKKVSTTSQILVNIESLPNESRQQAAGQYDQQSIPVKVDTCECTGMDVIVDGDIPAGSSLAFADVEQVDSKPKTLGPNVDTDDRLVVGPAGGGTMVENFRLNFMIDATVKTGSNVAKCSQEQQIRATVSKGAGTESPKDGSGTAFPFTGEKYVRDNTGYTEPSANIKEHVGTDPIHFRWIDAPGFGNSKEDRKKAGGGKSDLDLKAAFYVYVKGSGANTSCYCKFSVEMKMDKRGTIIQSPRILPDSKECRGSTDLPTVF